MFAHAKKLFSAGLCAALLGACVGSGTYHGTLVARSEPPPPRYEAYDPRPGYVWVDGHWAWDDYATEWVWYDGYYEPMRPGYVYVRGRWDRGGDGYVYSRPRWQSRTNAQVQVNVRDHSRPSKVRIRQNTGGHVPQKPVIIHDR